MLPKLLASSTITKLPNITHIFFDIDGTLVSGTNFMSPAVKNCISRLQENNIGVSLCSGRPYFGAKNIIQELNIQDPCILFGGAAIISPVDRSVLSSTSLDPGSVLALLDFAEERKLFCELYTNENYFVEQGNPLTKIHQEYLCVAPRIAPLRSIATQEKILKFQFLADDPLQKKVLRSLETFFPALPVSSAYGAQHPNLLFTSLSSPTSSRALAFTFLTQRLGILREDTMAFGDAESDIPLLTSAGIGIAMGNAPDAVKSIADYVTTSVDEDGVAFALEKLIQLKI